MFVEPMYWLFLRMQHYLFKELVKFYLFRQKSNSNSIKIKTKRDDDKEFFLVLPEVRLCEFPRPAGVSSDHFILAGNTFCVLLVAAFMNLFFGILRNVGVEKETQIKVLI